MSTFDPEPSESNSLHEDESAEQNPAEELTRAQGAGGVIEGAAEVGFEGPVDPR